MRIPSWRKSGFVAGVSVVLLVLASGVWKVAELAAPNLTEPAIDKLVELVEGPGPAFTKSTMYIAVYYEKSSDNKPIEVWKTSISGRTTYTATLEDVSTTGSKGIASGFIRADTLTLAYASKDPKRPGYGTFFLRSVHPATDDDEEIWAGTAVGHDCLDVSAGGKPTICTSTTLVACPALLSTHRIVPDDLQKLFFNKPCVPADRVEFPDTRQASR